MKKYFADGLATAYFGVIIHTAAARLMLMSSVFCHGLKTGPLQVHCSAF